MKNLINVYYLLRGNFSKIKIFYIFLISFAVMIFEAFTISLVLPLVNLFSNTNTKDNIILIYLNKYFNNFEANQLVISIIIFISIFFIIKFFFLIYVLYAQTNFYIKFKLYLSEKIFKGYLEMPYFKHINMNSAIFLRNTVNETESVAGIVKLIIIMLTEILVIFGISLVIIYINPISSLVVICYALVGTLIFYYFVRTKLLKWGQLRQFHEGKRIQHINEGIRGIKEVKLSNNLMFFFNAFAKHNYISNDVHKKRMVVSNLPKIWLEFILFFALMTIVLYFILVDKSTNAILSTLALFAAAAFRVLPSFQRILISYQGIRFQIPAINKIINEINSFEKDSKNINDNKIEFNNIIKFDDVHYSYISESNINIFKNLSFEIKKGDFIGIVGKSGTGKTTFFNLLSGLINPTEGQILVDKNNIANNSYWSSKIGYVPQETFILDNTIRSNITLNEDINKNDDKEIFNILKSVDLYEFVINQKNGLDTNLGESGQKISGGQKQRIGIARALYKKSTLIIFDESTSALDQYTEKKVLDTIKNLHEKITILMISHRIQTLNNCKRIYSLENNLLKKINK